MDIIKSGDLDEVEITDPFIEEVLEAKQQSIKTKPRTHSLPDTHNDYIHKKAHLISQSRGGKVVSASEALRVIIQEHSKGTHK